MDTKFSLNYTKATEDSVWNHIVGIDIQPRFGISGTALGSTRDQFLAFMTEQYGPKEFRYNLRWTDYGVDIRFRETSDAASFLMLHTKEKPPKITTPYYGIRGH